MSLLSPVRFAMQNNYLMPDTDAIAMTAKVLDASETRVFELAYQEWYGKPPQERELERIFLAYLFEGEVPCWLRAFNRHTLALCEEAGMELPVTQSGHNVTIAVSQPEMIWALIGLGAVCLGWLVGIM